MADENTTTQSNSTEGKKSFLLRGKDFIKDKVLTFQNATGAALSILAASAFLKDTETGNKIASEVRTRYPLLKKRIRDKFSLGKNGGSGTSA